MHLYEEISSGQAAQIFNKFHRDLLANDCSTKHTWKKWSKPFKKKDRLSIYVKFQRRICDQCGIVEERIV